MTLIDLPKRSWVLIEGPAPADARFLGQWLLAAAEADTLLQAQLEHDRSFKPVGKQDFAAALFCILAYRHLLRRTTDEQSRFVFFVSF